MFFEDQLHRKIPLTKSLDRIISLVPSQTELLVHLGLYDKIVGVTKFCVHPKTIKKDKQVIGGTKKIHYDKIRELQPDIILCNKEENTKEIVETLEKEFPVHVSDIATVEDALEMIIQYGDIFNKRKAAISLITELKNELVSFTNFLIDKPQKRVVYLIWRKPWMAVGAKTFIDHLLSLNNYINVLGNKERYPELTETEISELEVDMIMISTEPFPFCDSHVEEIKKIAPKAQVILVDGEYFSWYGSRLKAAFNYFKTLH